LSKNIAANGKDFTHLLSGLRVGSQRGICTACGEGFNSGTGFDRHQKFKNGEVVCTHPSKFGLIQDESGFWKSAGPPESVKGA
jgi:hypothetical protein